MTELHPIKLRGWQPDDSEAICELFHAAVNTLASQDYSFEQRQQWAHPRLNTLFWQQRLAETRPVLLTVGDRIAGFVELIKEDAYIDCLYVHPDFARQGIGSLLLQQVLNQALIARIPTLTVDASLTARPLFEKAGFHVVQENRHPRNGVELINYRMEKRLFPV